MNAIARIEPNDAIIPLVLDAADSGHTRRTYERAWQDFFAWYSEII